MRRYLKRMFHPLQSISFFDKQVEEKKVDKSLFTKETSTLYHIKDKRKLCSGTINKHKKVTEVDLTQK